MRPRNRKWLLFSFVVSVVFLLSFVRNGLTDTNVSGAIGSDTIWTSAGSPYI